MSKPGRLQGAFIAVVAVLLCVPRPAPAQDASTQEVQRYVLTDAALAKYKQAAKKLTALPGGPPGDCEDEGTDSPTLDQVAAKLNARPDARAALQSAGMTAREYILFSWSLIHNGLAAWAMTQPGGKLPPGTSKANVDFYNRHAAELAALGNATGDDECDGESAGEESDE